ncbi:MAG: TatD family hydrolase [Muribaculaceae bacterium]|nr:TatD family hydrolase [Muribaculaceae bacterium]
MIDSHSHIYGRDFNEDREEAIARAKQAGVRHIILPNENLVSVQYVVAARDAFPGYMSIALGLHPEEVKDDFEQKLAAMRPLLDEHHPVAVGEIGIDLYWDATWREQQMEALDTQLHWCKELNIPFIIHCRDALDEILSVMDNFGEPLPQGVFHSFTGTPQEVEKVRQRGDFYFGVNGIVTFKKSNVKEILPVVGLDRLLLETDSPYLAPFPFRGKRNESSYIPYICNFIAGCMGLSPEEVSRATDRNAIALFNIDLQ